MIRPTNIVQSSSGFIQFGILVTVIVGIIILGGGGFLAYNKVESEKGLKEENVRRQFEDQQRILEDQKRATEESQKQIETLRDEQKRALEESKKEIETLKANEEKTKADALKNQQALEKRLKNAEIAQKNAIPTEVNFNKIINQWGSSVVRIVCDAGDGQSIFEGSGTLWTSDGDYIVTTNQHVVGTEDCLVIVSPYSFGPVSKESRMIYKAVAGSFNYTLQYQDFVFFVLTVADPKWPLSNLVNYAHKINKNCTTDLYEVGTKVAIIGYPAIGTSGGTDLTTTEGIISGIESGPHQMGWMYVTSAKIEHGNSGGAVITGDGCFAGIPTFAVSGSVESQGRILPLSGEYSFLLRLFNYRFQDIPGNKVPLF